MAGAAETAWASGSQPENRCSPYNAGDYSYPQSVEPQIVAQQGGRIYGPYTGTYFASTGETDIEHIVARSEAHDSGLCAVDSAARKAFGRDLLNLTLASPSVNRHQKIAKDVAEWLPDPEPVLVREPGRTGQAQVQSHDEPGRGLDGATGAGLLRQDPSSCSSPTRARRRNRRRRLARAPVRRLA